MRLRGLLAVAMVSLGSFVTLVTTDAPAADEAIPVVVSVVGRGTIRARVADGTSLPCDSSANHLLFDGHLKAGDRINLASLSGSVCVDHTYGAFRESQWAGGTLWSGARFKPWSNRQPEPVIRGTLSTDAP
jgi:hypothetical protein